MTWTEAFRSQKSINILCIESEFEFQHAQFLRIDPNNQEKEHVINCISTVFENCSGGVRERERERDAELESAVRNLQIIRLDAEHGKAQL